jgi:hypothetical protein
MKRLAITITVLCACASTPRVVSPVDLRTLQPHDDSVAVRIESQGPVQNLAVVPSRSEASQGMLVDTWCQTPCTLYLGRGEHTLWTGAPTVMDAVTTVTVRDQPMVLHTRAPLRAEWQRGRNLLVGGVGLATVAGIFLAFSPLEVTGGSPTGTETIVVGLGVGVLSAALMVFGLRVMGQQHPGIDVAELQNYSTRTQSSQRDKSFPTTSRFQPRAKIIVHVLCHKRIKTA